MHEMLSVGGSNICTLYIYRVFHDFRT